MTITRYVDRSCLICREVSTNVAISSTVKAEELSFDELKSHWSGFFKNKIVEKFFFSYSRCPKCSLLYCASFFSDQQLSELYQKMSDNTAGVTTSALIKTQHGYFSHLKNHIPSQPGGYLEIGPDVGFFTDLALKEKNYDQFWMVEPNQEVWDTLESKLKDKPHHIYSDLLIENCIPDNSLSTVVMIHVLDHLLDPLKVLTFLKTKLKKNGVLLFVTHDESSLLAKMLKQRWLPYCLQHPQLFNPNSIKLLLEKAGFETLSVSKTYNYFPMTYLAKHLLWAIGIRNIKLPQWNALQLPLKLGNIITVARY